jgi:hypothetical protein
VIWVFVVLAVLTTFVIAAVAVGSSTAQLATRARRSVYDLEEAIVFVADQLPPEITAEIGFDDVRAVLGWNLDYLQSTGIASPKAADDPGSGLIVVGDAEPLAWVLGRLESADEGSAGSSLSDLQVVAILEANRSYEVSIGAIGDEVVAPRLD